MDYINTNTVAKQRLCIITLKAFLKDTVMKLKINCEKTKPKLKLYIQPNDEYAEEPRGNLF